MTHLHWALCAVQPLKSSIFWWPSGTVPECDRAVVGLNPTNGCCVPTPTQRATPPGLVNEYQQKLGSKRAYHTIHQSRIRDLAASAGVRLRAMKRRSAPPHGPLRLGKGLYYYIIQYTHDSSRVVVQLSIFETRKSLCFFLEVGSVAGLGCSTHQGGQRAVYDVDVWLWFSELIDETRNPHPAARANNTAPSNNATINISNNATAWSPLVSFSLSLSLSLSRFLYEDWLTVRVWNWVLNSKKTGKWLPIS